MPKTRREPEVGESSPAISRISVVFPAPSGPITAVRQPVCREIPMPFSAVTGGAPLGVNRLTSYFASTIVSSFISEFHPDGGGHAEPEAIVRVVDVDADLIEE